MRKIIGFLAKLSSGIYVVEKWALIISVLTVVSINFVQVVSRYLFKSSIPWCEQLSVILFMFMVLIGGNIAVKTNDEIKIEIIKFKDGKKDQAFRMFSDVISMLTMFFLLIGSVNLVKQSKMFAQALATLPLKYYQLYAMLVIGFSLMFLDKLISLLKRIDYVFFHGEAEVIK